MNGLGTRSASESLDDIRRRHGNWTAMSIHLGGELYTLPPAPDGRLRRILQMICDLAGEPLSQLRVLDLACLEGHYGIEMAMHGAEVVCIELREANLAKAEFAKNYLGLDNLTLHKDDVRNLSVEKYGKFDVVICSGILYHLTTPDVFHFVRQIYEVCTRLAIFDTQIALHPREMVEFDGQPYYGIWFTEHDPSANKETRLKDVWASVDNVRSFWFTQPSFSNLIASVGFSSLFECLNPAHAVPADRRAYAAIRGRVGSIRTSPATESMGLDPTPERNLLLPAEAQIKHGQFFRLAKRLLPQPVKDFVKPILRFFRFIPPDATPPWAKNK
jgi:hypothetical protein